MLRTPPVLGIAALASLLGCAGPPTAEPSKGESTQVTPKAQDNDKYVALTDPAYGAWHSSKNAPTLGDTVEDFELPDADGGSFRLSTALATGKPVVLLFYRGFW